MSRTYKRAKQDLVSSIFEKFKKYLELVALNVTTTFEVGPFKSILNIPGIEYYSFNGSDSYELLSIISKEQLPISIYRLDSDSIIILPLPKAKYFFIKIKLPIKTIQTMIRLETNIEIHNDT